MRKILIVLVILLITVLAIGVSVSTQEVATNLQAPSAEGSSFLEKEAGITAYTKVSQVNLLKAKLAFKNVEKATDTYVIGSVSLPDYGESADVHVYVDASGWIAAYYLGKEPASKIIDWLDYSGGKITSTKLEDALVQVTKTLEVEMPYTKYYDFRYPEATKIMIVTDGTSSGTENFKILIPGTYTVYSRTWSHALYSGRKDLDGNLKIDGTKLHSGRSPDDYHWRIWEGTITPTQLSPNSYHTISVWSDGDGSSYGAVVLIYKE